MSSVYKHMTLYLIIPCQVTMHHTSLCTVKMQLISLTWTPWSGFRLFLSKR